MSAVRRRILRPELPVRPESATDQRRRLAAAKTQRQLEQERTALARWMSRSKRAVHVVERGQLRVTRLQRIIAQLDQNWKLAPSLLLRSDDSQPDLL
jgi:hypothetical protein